MELNSSFLFNENQIWKVSKPLLYSLFLDLSLIHFLQDDDFPFLVFLLFLWKLLVLSTSSLCFWIVLICFFFGLVGRVESLLILSFFSSVSDFS